MTPHWTKIPERGLLSSLDLVKLFGLRLRGDVGKLVARGELPIADATVGFENAWQAATVRAHLRRRGARVSTPENSDALSAD